MLQSSDALDDAAACLVESLKECREVERFFTKDSWTDFQKELKRFLQLGLTQVGAGDLSVKILCHRDNLEQLVTLIIEAFQRPLPLGESASDAALGHLQHSLTTKNSHTLAVFRKLYASLQSAAGKLKDAKPLPRHKSLEDLKQPVPRKTQKPGGKPMTPSKAQRVEADVVSNASTDVQVDKAVDCAQIIAMANRLVPKMDIDTVREVQRTISADFREIMKEAKLMGHPGINTSPEQTKAMHFMWMMFCHAKGSQRKAEEAVSKKLRKAEPALALLLYGPAALIELDSRGLRKDKSKNAGDDYLALDAALEQVRLKIAGGGKQQSSSQCGISGLLHCVFGEFDYAGLVTEELTNLDKSSKVKLIQSLVGKIPKEELEYFEQLEKGNSGSKQVQA